MKRIKVLILLLLIIITGCTQESVKDAISKTSPITTPENTDSGISLDGTYIVGNTLDAGIYKVELKSSKYSGYIERSLSKDLGFSNIIANENYYGNGYIEIKATDVAVKISGVRLIKIDFNNFNPVIKNIVSTGTYLINYELKPGIYKVTKTTDSLGYLERKKSVTMGMDDIITNDNISGNGYVEIKNTDYAIKVSGLTLQYIDLNYYEKNIKDIIGEGTYLVNYDLLPGKYKVELTDDSMGFVYLRSNVDMGLSGIKSTYIIENQTEITISSTVFAVDISGAKLTLIP